MPRASEIMSMRGMGMPRTPGQGAVRRAMMQRPVSPMLPTAVPSGKGGAIVKRSPKLSPLASRMSAAYDKLEASKQTDQLTQAALGKLILEIQQTNANIAGMRQGLTQQSRQKKQISNEEKKLLKKEEDNLVSVRGAFLDVRAKLGLFAGALAIKSALEGRPGDAAANAGVAVASFLPEIINIVSGVVLGKVLLGGGKGGVPKGRMAMPRGGGKLGLGLGLLGLLGVGGMAMSQGNDADMRRKELIKQGRENVITPDDTKRFGDLSNRFDAILSRMESNQTSGADRIKKPGENEEKKKPGILERSDESTRRGGPDRSGTASRTRTDTKVGMSVVDSDIIDFRKFRNEQFGASADRRDPPDSSARNFDIREMGVYGANDYGINPMADDDRYDIELHKGAGHHENRAFDIPIDTAENGRMVAEFWRSRGYTVIFDSPGHYNHVHVEVPKNKTQEYFRIKQEQTNLENKSQTNEKTNITPDQILPIPEESGIKLEKVPFEKTSSSSSTGSVNIIPVAMDTGQQQQQSPLLLSATSPQQKTVDIDPNYNDVTGLLQKLSYSSEALV